MQNEDGGKENAQQKCASNIHWKADETFPKEWPAVRWFEQMEELLHITYDKWDADENVKDNSRNAEIKDSAIIDPVAEVVVAEAVFKIHPRIHNMENRFGFKKNANDKDHVLKDGSSNSKTKYSQLAVSFGKHNKRILKVQSIRTQNAGRDSHTKYDSVGSSPQSRPFRCHSNWEETREAEQEQEPEKIFRKVWSICNAAHFLYVSAKNHFAF